MAEQLTDKDWVMLAQCLDDPNIKSQLKKKISSAKKSKQKSEHVPKQTVRERVEQQSEQQPAQPEPAPEPREHSERERSEQQRKRTSGKTYRTPEQPEPSPDQDGEPELQGATAGIYAVPVYKRPRPKKVPQNIQRKQQYLDAIANKDDSIRKEVEINGKKTNRKKSYREWCREQFEPEYNDGKFTVKDQKIAPRKVFQSTVVREAYKLVQNNPKLKGPDGGNIRLKTIAKAIKNFGDVYRDPNFFTFIQDPVACRDMINDFAMELEELIKQY